MWLRGLWVARECTASMRCSRLIGPRVLRRARSTATASRDFCRSRLIEAQGGVEAIAAHERALADRFLDGVREIPGINLYGAFDQPTRSAIVSLNVGDIDSAEISDALMQGWGIATRPGAHCAPLMHRALGTERQGVVRFSFGYFNTDEEVDTAIDALRDLAC